MSDYIKEAWVWGNGGTGSGSGGSAFKDVVIRQYYDEDADSTTTTLAYEDKEFALNTDGDLWKFPTDDDFNEFYAYLKTNKLVAGIYITESSSGWYNTGYGCGWCDMGENGITLNCNLNTIYLGNSSHVSNG